MEVGSIDWHFLILENVMGLTDSLKALGFRHHHLKERARQSGAGRKGMIERNGNVAPTVDFNGKSITIPSLAVSNSQSNLFDFLAGS